jgi:hypothetical protein
MRLLVVLGLFVSACSSCNSNNTNNNGMDLSANVIGDGGNEDLSGDLAVIIMCKNNSDACTVNGDCCSNSCDPTMHICVAGMCKNTGDTCGVASECCSLTCLNSKCGGACVADNTACVADGDCCSKKCLNNMCEPICQQLGLACTCASSGNPCTANGDSGIAGNCCSGQCKNGTCSLASSYCTQVGDICFKASECCTGVCNIPTGGTAGLCAALNSPVSCEVDGTLCNGCGGCCSRLCAPFAASGVSICQPASGCHVYGDLCHKDSDCCGGEAPDAGLPGAGLVSCTLIPGAGGIGFCDHPKGSGGGGNACDPEGDVCHKLNYACSNSSDRNDCCACIAGKECCQLDPLGIPRCNAINPGDGGVCVPQGGNCSFSGDCCGGLPCVPDSTGQLKCGAGIPDGGICVSEGGVCTTTADCCAGVTCIIAAGQLTGTCTVLNPPPPDLANYNPDAGPIDLATPPICSEIGQACDTYACCTGLICQNATTGADCGTTGAGCICTVVVK